MATRTPAATKRRPASKAKRRVTTGKDAVGTRTAGAAKKPTRKNAVAKKRAAGKATAKKTVRKAPAKKTARKTVAKKSPAKKTVRKAAPRKKAARPAAKKAVRKAPRKLTTAQAAAKIQALLEAKHERDRIPPVWAEPTPHATGADSGGDAFHMHEAPPDVTHGPAGTSTQIIQPKRGQRS